MTPDLTPGPFSAPFRAPTTFKSVTSFEVTLLAVCGLPFGSPGALSEVPKDRDRSERDRRGVEEETEREEVQRKREKDRREREREERQ